MKLKTYNNRLAESVWWNLLWLTIGAFFVTVCAKSVVASHAMLAGGVLGMALLDAKEMVEKGVDNAMDGITPMALAVGFVAAFLTGCAACRLMINLVKKGKMLWFAVYCAVVGVIVLASQLC